jgi:thiosulfate dehydrogenase (quinone) large subunit
MGDRNTAIPHYSTIQLTSLVILRVLIGWHFLYEGIAKLLSAHWSAASYLLESKWIFSGLFVWMASNPVVLILVNFLNIWGLIAIGMGLVLGGMTRIASFAGVLILLLYYICNPPFIGYTYSMPMEGSYLIVNKNLVELFSLVVLIVFPTGSIIGLDRLMRHEPIRRFLSRD